jgi:hypothetical protein
VTVPTHRRNSARAVASPAFGEEGARDLAVAAVSAHERVGPRPWLGWCALPLARTVAAATDLNGALVTNWASHALCPPTPGLARRAPMPNLD